MVRTSGVVAFANFRVVAPDGCLHSDLHLALTAESPPSAPTSARHIFVMLSKYDACTDTAVFSNQSLHAVSAEELMFSHQSVIVRKTLELPDDLALGGSLSLAIDASWLAAARPFLSGRSLSRERDSMFVLLRTAGVAREAEVVGTISDGDVDYASGIVSNAQVAGGSDALLVVPDELALQASASKSSISGPIAGGSPPTSIKGEAEFSTAVWESFDTSGCIRNLGILTVESRREGTGERPPTTSVFAEFSRMDQCTNESIFLIQVPFPFPTVAANSFRLSPNLAGAELTGSIDAIDGVSGATVRLAFDVDWNGTGVLTRSATISRNVLFGEAILAYAKEEHRAAVPTGSITLESGPNLIDGFPVGPDDLIFGGIGHFRFATLTDQP
jgi:hypothetical protein